MEEGFIDLCLILFILGGIAYGIITLGFWFAFAVAIVYLWLRIG